MQENETHKILLFFLFFVMYWFVNIDLSCLGFKGLYKSLLSSCVLIICWLLSPYKEEKEIRKIGRKKIFGLILITVCVYIVGQFIASFLVPFSEGYQIVQKNITAPLGLKIITVGVLGPVVEEILFRQYLYKGLVSLFQESRNNLFCIRNTVILSSLKKLFNVKSAAILSSLVFGALHFNLVQFVYAGIFGLFFCIVYEYCGTLKAPIFMHILSNIFSLFPLLPTMDFPIACIFVSIIIVFVGCIELKGEEL